MTQKLKDQTHQRYIGMHRAKAQAYNDARKIQGIYLFIAIPVAVMGSILSAKNPSLAPYFALFSIIAPCIFTCFLEDMIFEKRKLGARIQEELDCELYSLLWTKNVELSRPDHEDISELSQKYQKKNSNDAFHAWYPESAFKIPRSIGILICQRSNVWWDTKSRKEFLRVLWIFLLALVIASVAIGIYLSFSTGETILLLFVPMWPLYDVLIREIKTQVSIYKSGNELRDSITQHCHTIDGSKDPESIDDEQLRIIQDKILKRRMTSNIIPNILYKYNRDEYESQMQEAAAEIAKPFLVNGQ